MPTLSNIKSSIIINVRAIKARAYVRIIGQQRELSWLFFDSFLPLLSIAAFVYVYKAMQAPPEFTGFVILGGAMTAFWMNVLWSMASQFYWEKEGGNLQLYLIAPMSRMSILAGMALGGGFSTTIRASSALLVGIFIFHIPINIIHPWLTLAIFVVTLLALYGFGMLFASLYLLFGREAWHMSNLLTEPIFLLSGFYFPVKALGFYVAAVASIIPATLGLDAMRQLAFPDSAQFGFLTVGSELIILSILAVAFIVLARFSLGYMEKLGKREGRLTMRWQ
jgi:ABC-2 type transport system permease protein